MIPYSSRNVAFSVKFLNCTDNNKAVEEKQETWLSKGSSKNGYFTSRKGGIRNGKNQEKF